MSFTWNRKREQKFKNRPEKLFRKSQKKSKKQQGIELFIIILWEGKSGDSERYERKMKLSLRWVQRKRVNMWIRTDSSAAMTLSFNQWKWSMKFTLCTIKKKIGDPVKSEAKCWEFLHFHWSNFVGSRWDFWLINR